MVVGCTPIHALERNVEVGARCRGARRHLAEGVMGAVGNLSQPLTVLDVHTGLCEGMEKGDQLAVVA